MRGVVNYGAYLPYWRLERKAIAEALGTAGGGGTRAVASYDEDTTSLGVEAGRAALRGAAVVPQALYFATSDPAYLDKTNATAIHAALDLPTSAFAVDVVGSVRSAVGAMRAARDARPPALAVLSDIRTGSLPPGNATSPPPLVRRESAGCANIGTEQLGIDCVCLGSPAAC